MSAGRRLVPLFWMVAVIASCADSTAPRPLETVESQPTREPTPEELEQLPPEFSFPTQIIWHEIHGGYVNGTAWAEVRMRYFATDAKATISLQLFHGNTPIGPMVQAVEERSAVLPADRTIRAMASVGVPGDCGYRHDAHATSTVVNRAIIPPGVWLAWQQRGTSGSNNFAQPACACNTGGGYGGENGEMATNTVPAGVSFQCSEPTGGPSGGGGGGSGSTGGAWVQVTTTTCHGTHYYDENGKYLHSQIHYCEQSTSYYYDSAA